MTTPEWSKKLEMAANIAIIVLATVASLALARRYLFSKPTAPVEPFHVPVPMRGPDPGTKVSLAGEDWKQNKRTLLLAISRECRFCTASAPFYRRLAEAAGRANTRLVAVFQRETPAGGKQYLGQLGIPISDVKQAPLESIGVHVTPALVLVDGSGVVAGSWAGLL
ncbi:MAG TPA: hypothetical protein VJX67_05430, partial [Blastocatellia bacterium]|nr:hypothetical protein [Blastocatellia bacterium]